MKILSKRLDFHSNRSISVLIGSVLTILLFALAFFVLQRLTFLLRFPPFARTTVWTPGALLFTFLLLAPPRGWWVYYVGLCLGAFAAYYSDAAISAPTALLAAQFHFVAVVLGVWGVRRFSSNSPFENAAAFFVFVLAAGLLVPVGTTAPIDLLRWASGADDVWPVAVRSVLCVSLGLLIATPALTLTVANGLSWLRTAAWRQIAEFALLWACLLTIGHWVFGYPANGDVLPALLYAPAPVLLWAAMRFELAGVTWALLAVAYQSTWGAIHGRGPFSGGTTADNVLQLQLFLMSISLPLMFLAVVIQERSRAFASLLQAEQEVRRQHAQFRLAVEAVPSAILMVDPWGNIVLVNAQTENLFRYEREELIGQPVEMLMPERVRDSHRNYREAFFAHPAVRPMAAVRDLSGRRKDGSEFPVEVGLTPIPTAEGQFVLSAILDITERKRAEEARQELIHASRLALLGEFTASIAHEINQPLGAILSNADAAEMLLDASPPPLDEVRQILTDIRNDDLRASDVIQRLRSLLRRRELELRPVHLKKVIADVLGLVRAESQRRQIDVQTRITDRLPIVSGDKVHLQQILLNLLINGMEAMSDTSGTRRLTVSTTLSGSGFVEVAVADTGQGIPPDQLPRVFDRFFSTKSDGIGLGLAITQSLVEAHGGRIWAENPPGEGATFRFTLPVSVQNNGESSLSSPRTTVEPSA